MSNLSPDFVLPENFCANPQEAWTIPARFYTDQNAFEHEMKWHTEFGHLNRGDMLTSEQHRCSNE
ncbi:hypothetical protein RSW80_07280, partial [Escherichia coli]|nr:hypothetical protein [Escherichia coli]